MADFTPTQGRYLAFIQSYLDRHGRPPAESEIAAAMCVSPPSVNQMIKTLEKRGLILRQPGKARSLEIVVPAEQIPVWGNKRRSQTPSAARPVRVPTVHPPARLYVLSVFLTAGPISDKYARNIIQRVIEIRGDQTLEQLHQAIFKAYDRWEEHLYEFQFGKRPMDPAGPNIGISDSLAGRKSKSAKPPNRDARTTTLDDMKLDPQRVFGYWFDFGDSWFHQVQVERIEQAISTVDYPRVIKRVGKSPPQYENDSE